MCGFIGLSGREALQWYAQTLTQAAQRVLSRLYSSDQLSNIERNDRIRTLHANGVGVSEIAAQFDISPQRVWQIVRGRNR